MNLIVIVADSLRVDHLGTYGSSVKTPNVDRLAAESTLLENAYAENLPTFHSSAPRARQSRHSWRTLAFSTSWRLDLNLILS